MAPRRWEWRGAVGNGAALLGIARYRWEWRCAVRNGAAPLRMAPRPFKWCGELTGSSGVTSTASAEAMSAAAAL
eukprot:903428-Pleurochrysis_carterae.AAC.1